MTVDDVIGDTDSAGFSASFAGTVDFHVISKVSNSCCKTGCVPFRAGSYHRRYIRDIYKPR